MRKLIFCSLLVTLLINFTEAQRPCGAVERFQMMSAQDPSLMQRRDAIEHFTQSYVNAGGGTSGSRSIINIPVVVHVIYNTPAQNVSDAQILSQIDVLNRDYRKLNPDWVNTPSPFQGLVADIGLQFSLAQRDPNGNATTGIIRKPTSVVSFGLSDAIKYSAQGGDDAWPSSSYLNLWVCYIGGSYLGYAEYPGGSPSTDGVVISYIGFGTCGTATFPYNKGRTTTHEVGHWLNLIHTWGDDSGGCTGTDNVDDTPNQADFNSGCPLFPKISCNNAPNGDMFMNYMDYSNDDCVFMFTAGQNARIHALFAPGGPRAALQNSLGANAPNGCGAPTALCTSNITQTSAQISWTPISSAISYNVQYKLSTASVWTTLSTNSATINLTGLTNGSIYNYQVQSVCSSGSSGYVSASAFTTLSSISCGIPAGLTATGVAQTTATVQWGTVSGSTGYILQYRPTGSLIWTTIQPSSNLVNLAGLTSGMTYTFQVQALCGAGISGFSAPYSFTTGTTGSCGIPSGLASTYLAQTSATALWTAVSGAIGYNIQYKPSSSGSWTTQYTTGNSLSITGLTSATSYTFQVQSVCSSSTSTYSPTSSFTTLTPTLTCDIPSGLSCINIAQTSASINWAAVSSASYYHIHYKASSSSTWDILSSTSNSTTISGLTAGTNYDYQVQTVCSFGNGSYSTTYSFTTSTSGASCNVPAALSSTNISQTSASISWGAVGGALTYNVQYKPTSSATWSSPVSTTSASFGLTGLVAATGYDYQVQTVCSAGSSVYSTAYSFTTLPPVITCGTPSGLASTNITQTSAAISWSTVTGAASYNVQYKPSLSSTWNTLSSGTISTGLSGLTASTNYDFRIQTVCSSGTSSYSVTSSFLTQAVPVTCDAPSVFTCSNITQTSATVSWTGTTGATGYNFQYKESSGAAWTIIFTISPSVNLSGLNAGVNHVYQVQTVCSSGSSGFSNVSSFTTAAPVVTCDVPFGLSNSNISQYSATGIWTGAAGATLYNVQYKASAATTWSTISSSAASINFSSLLPQTSYDYQVQTVCSSGNSNYSTPITFTTLPPAAAPTCTDNFEPNNSLNSAIDIPLSSDITGLMGISNDVDYFKFTISNSAQKYIKIALTNLPGDYDVKLLKSNGTSLAQAQHSGTVNEIIKYTKAVAGVYYIQVYSRNHVFNASSCYTLNAAISTTAMLREAGEPEDDNSETPSGLEMSLYPNPSTGVAAVDFNVTEPLDFVEIQVYDMLGKQIRNYAYTDVAGFFKANIDLNDVTNGVYNVLINTPAGNETRKLIIAK